MNNSDVIQLLQAAANELSRRLHELIEMQSMLTAPLGQLADRQARLAERISALNLRLLSLQTRINERTMAENLGAAVPQLSNGRIAALQQALQDVNRSILGVQDFQGRIALATRIADAAARAHSDSALT